MCMVDLKGMVTNHLNESEMIEDRIFRCSRNSVNRKTNVYSDKTNVTEQSRHN